ncbi:SH3 beta-barrel fold-containing protein [Maribacter sp. 2307UL18-2]|uniref:SH3 beta-barrel fold-containing protein n=1 Tax=Maribacter sp. 2307UL18-2 TaxID=3386274 RepID=UPI0039BCAA7E
MDKSHLFKQAWVIAKATGKSFRIALVKAWSIYKLKMEMLKRKVKIAYEKKDGSLRYAMATMQSKFLGDIKGLRAPNPKVVTYYDLDSMAFRCFKAENLIQVY